MNQELIGKYIAEKRKKKGITQKELAERLNISEKTVSKWECGNGLPEVSLMQPVCKELGITVNELLSGEDLKNNNEDKVIEYIKYKDNKNIKITTIITVILLLITSILLTITHIKYKKFYKTNYNNNTVYKLSGENENFIYDNLVIIESPTKTIAISGYISSNNETNIPSDTIYKYVLRYKKRIIFSNTGNVSKEHSMVLEEPLGYNELFTEEVLKNKDKWEIDIFYEKDNEKHYETIKLDKSELLSSNKFKNEKVESIDNGESIYEYDPNADLCTSLYKEEIERLTKNGFARQDERCEFILTEEKGNTINIELMPSKIEYNLDKYSLTNFYKVESNIIYIQKDDKNYEYDKVTKKIKCAEDKCLSIDASLEKDIDTFNKIINKYIKGNTN